LLRLELGGLSSRLGGRVSRLDEPDPSGSLGSVGHHVDAVLA
jgi:hypothetical protein